MFMYLLVSVRLEAVQQLSVATVSEGSVRVRWSGVNGVRAYRLVWGPFTGQQEASAVGTCLHWHAVRSFVFLLFQKVG